MNVTSIQVKHIHSKVTLHICIGWFISSINFFDMIKDVLKININDRGIFFNKYLLNNRLKVGNRIHKLVWYSLTHTATSATWQVYLYRYNELTVVIWGIQIRRSCQHILPFMLSTIDHFLGKLFFVSVPEENKLPQDL